MATKLEAQVYTKEGKDAGVVTLPAAVFGAKWNPDLVHEVVTLMRGNERSGTAHTKNRGEVRGGGKKPWKQKGTGRARHGSRRSPIWKGGGVTFGPRSEKEYGRKINKSARAKAFASVLSKKFEDGSVIFVESLAFSAPKAKEAQGILAALAKAKGCDMAVRKKNAALIALPARDTNTEKSFRNFGNITVAQAKDMNPVDLLTYKYVVVAAPSETLKTLERRVATRVARKAMTAK